jgi:hypothetical protein
MRAETGFSRRFNFRLFQQYRREADIAENSLNAANGRISAFPWQRNIGPESGPKRATAEFPPTRHDRTSQRNVRGLCRQAHRVVKRSLPSVKMVENTYRPSRALFLSCEAMPMI